MTWQILAVAALLCIAVPFLLTRIGKGDYADNEGMSVEGWRRIWARLFGAGDS